MSFRFTRAMGRERVTRETQHATRSLLFVAFVFLSSFARDRSCVSANSIARNERNEKVGVSSEDDKGARRSDAPFTKLDAKEVPDLISFVEIVQPRRALQVSVCVCVCVCEVLLFVSVLGFCARVLASSSAASRVPIFLGVVLY